MTSKSQPAPVAGELGNLGWRGHAALQAAAAGQSVFPLLPGTKRPAIADWENAATTDPDQIIEWWRQRPYNLGVAAGKSGLVVIDLDHGRGETAAEPFTGCRDGREVLAQLAREAGQPAPWATYAVTTPTGGGLHLYFRAPEGSHYRNSAGRLGWHVDVRSHGGYVVAATSTYCGRQYRAQNRQAAAPLPGWLAERLDALAAPPQPAAVPEPGPVTAPLPVTIAPGRITNYVQRIVDDELEELGAVAAGHGRRHGARLKAARALGRLVGEPRNGLAQDAARAALLAVAGRHVGVYRSPDGQPKSTTRHEVERDIDDGLAYGRNLARDIGAEITNWTAP